jgi:hypothetical protein
MGRSKTNGVDLLTTQNVMVFGCVATAIGQKNEDKLLYFSVDFVNTSKEDSASRLKKH